MKNVKENLNFKISDKFVSKEANRKVKNLWHRTIVEHQINKRCSQYGIQLIEVNACYSSFIGNLMYENFDAVNASIEICRRGMFKYRKELFYPKYTSTISDTMSKLITEQNIQLTPRDAQILKDCEDWKKLYKIAQNNVLKWRWGWEDIKSHFPTFSMNSVKSKVKLINFI